MTSEEKLELTSEQENAFRSFERAHRKCKKAGITFYTVLEKIFALNGEYLVRVHDDGSAGDFCLQDINNPFIFDWGFSGWADDDHFAEVRASNH